MTLGLKASSLAH